MLNKFILSFTSLLLAASANAEISPVYKQLRIIDEAVQAMTTIVGGDADEMQISKIDIKSVTAVEVTTPAYICKVSIKFKPMPPGMAGAAKVSGSVSKKDCKDTESELPSLSYESIGPKLSKAASLGKMIDAIEVKLNSKGNEVLVISYQK